MKTIDLPVGARVAYDRWQMRDKHTFVEAYVIAHRPKGSKSSYWGSRTGNNDTIAIMYYEPWGSDLEKQTIKFKWVQPSNIHYLWSDYEIIQNKNKTYRDEEAKRQAEKAADWTARFNALPKAVQDLVPDYKQAYLLEHGTVQMYVSIELLEKIVEATP